jgi:predicted nucleotidyltransferase
MNVVENLKPDVQKYLRLRKVFRTIEILCLAALFIVLLYSDGENLTEIIICVAVVVIIPEAFLAIQRLGVKTSIKYARLLEETDLDFYSKQKDEAEKIKEELVSQETNPSLTVESLKIIEREKLNSGWVSNRIKYYKFLCDNLQETLEQLNKMKRLVNY